MAPGVAFAGHSGRGAVDAQFLGGGELVALAAGMSQPKRATFVSSSFRSSPRMPPGPAEQADRCAGRRAGVGYPDRGCRHRLGQLQQCDVGTVEAVVITVERNPARDLYELSPLEVLFEPTRTDSLLSDNDRTQCLAVTMVVESMSTAPHL